MFVFLFEHVKLRSIIVIGGTNERCSACSNNRTNTTQGLTLSTVPSSGTSDIGRRTSTSVQLLFRLTSGIIRRIILRVITGPVKSPLLKKIGSDLQEIYESMKTCEPIAQQSSVTS